MLDFNVTKEYLEDVGERDEDGYYEFAYRYWSYSFQRFGRNYSARIYTDTPQEASVIEMDGTRHREYEDDLGAIAEYLHREAGVKTILTLGGPGGGFQPTLFD